MLRSTLFVLSAFACISCAPGAMEEKKTIYVAAVFLDVATSADHGIVAGEIAPAEHQQALLNPLAAVALERIPGRYFLCATKTGFCSFYYGETLSLKALPSKEMCTDRSVGLISLTSEKDPTLQVIACFEEDLTLSLCKNNAEICGGMQRTGWVAIGVCVYADADPTGTNWCARDSECASGHCDIGDPAKVAIAVVDWHKSQDVPYTFLKVSSQK